MFSREEALRIVERSGLELLEVSLNPMLLRGLRLKLCMALHQRLVAGAAQADVLVEAGVELARDREHDGDRRECEG